MVQANFVTEKITCHQVIKSMIEVTFGLKHCSVNSAGLVNQVKFFDFWRTGANYIPRLGGLSRAIKLRSKYRVHLLKIILFQKSLPPSLWLD